MMKASAKYMTAAMLAAMGVQAPAQNLVKEVVTEREIEPVERPAVRPSWVSPAVTVKRSEVKRLSPGEYTGTAELTRTVSTLEPVAYKDSVEVSPYRGYAALGYFPAFNLGASAGYRFINNKSTNAGAWLQYDGASWRGYDKEADKTSLNTLTIGADGTHHFGFGRLSAQAAYTYSRAFAWPICGDKDNGKQSMNDIGLRVDWNGTIARRWRYNVGAHIGYTAMGNDRMIVASPFSLSPSSLETPRPMTLPGMHETSYGGRLGVSYQAGEKSAWMVDVDADFLSVDNSNSLLPWAVPLAIESGTSASVTTGTWYATNALFSDGRQTLGDIAVTPAFAFARNRFSGRAGLRFDFNTGYNHKVRLSPQLKLSWAPTSLFAATLDVTGGETLNHAAGLWAECPWTTGVLATNASHIPVDAQLSVTFGQWNGMSARVYGGWSRANDWLTPVAVADVYAWAAKSIDGLNYGIDLSYQWRDKVTATASAQGARHGHYYRWRDNAKWVFDINVRVTPIKPLAVEAGWNVRVDRRMWSLKPVVDNDLSWPALFPYWDGDHVNLGDANNLHLGASWQFNDALTAFIKVENLLNHHWSLMPGLRSNGVHGAVGAAYKF